MECVCMCVLVVFLVDLFGCLGVRGAFGCRVCCGGWFVNGCVEFVYLDNFIENFFFYFTGSSGLMYESHHKVLSFSKEQLQ